MSDQDRHELIRAFLAERRQQAEAFLAELVRVPSDNPPGDCAPHGERAATLLEQLGFEVERHPVPASECRENGMISATNLVVRRRFGEGPTIGLNAHGDVVAPGDGWTHDPYGAEIENGILYGRGAAVSKSDFATYAFALLALGEVAASLRGTVELHLTYDEEAGGEIGPGRLLREGIVAPDYCISAGFSHSVVTAHNGCLHLEVTLRGKSAHAAMPDTGRDALAAATGVLARLYAERERLLDTRSRVPGIDTPALTVGLIEGGINTNVVPDRVTFRLDRRIIPEENAERVEQELAGVIREAAAAHAGVGCEVRRVMRAGPLVSLEGTPALADAVARHARRLLREEIPVLGVPLYTDARHYSEAGIPTVIYGAGPRTLLDANAHRADERLELADLHCATEVVACAVGDLLSS